MKRKRRKAPPTRIDPRTARAMLATFKSFAGDFQTISLTQAGTTIAVTFNGQSPKHDAPAAKRKNEPKRKMTAIDSLSLPTPTFEGWEQ